MASPVWLRELLEDDAKGRDRWRSVSAFASTIVGPTLIAMGSAMQGIASVSTTDLGGAGGWLLGIGLAVTLIFGVIAHTVIPQRFFRLIFEFEALEDKIKKLESELVAAQDTATRAIAGRALVEEVLLDVAARVRQRLHTTPSLDSDVAFALAVLHEQVFWRLLEFNEGVHRSLSVYIPDGSPGPSDANISGRAPMLRNLFRSRSWSQDRLSRMLPAQEDGGGYVGLAYSRRKGYQHGDLRTLPDRKPASQRDDDDAYYASFIAVPIFAAQGEIIGVLCVTSSQPEHLGSSGQEQEPQHEQFLAYAEYLANILSPLIHRPTLAT